MMRVFWMIVAGPQSIAAPGALWFTQQGCGGGISPPPTRTPLGGGFPPTGLGMLPRWRARCPS